jgi:archaellum component FlaF (FlaF/FlaG flagellin family)
MKRIYLVLSVAVAMLFFSSCSQSLVPFTVQMQEKYGLTKTDLTEIQFYISEDVVLTQEKSGVDKALQNGKFVAVSNKKTEQVIIPINTPCIVVDTNAKGNLKVVFGNDDDTYLTFGSEHDTRKFVLLAEEWVGTKGTVTYGANKYYTSKLSHHAHLLVDDRKIRKEYKLIKTEIGRKLY